MCRLEFAVIDLDRQGNAFAEFVRGWTSDDVLTYLELYGRVRPPMWEGTELYSHQSHFGLRGFFYFDEQGEFVIYRSGWLPY